MQGKNRDGNVENTLVDTGGREAGTTWEATLIHSREHNRRLVGAAASAASAQCSVMTRGVGRQGGEGGRGHRHVYG